MTCIPLMHVQIEFRENSVDVTFCYGLDEQTLRAAQIELAKKGGKMSAAELSDWVSDHGGCLDCDTGPAFTATGANGLRLEEWYRDGKVHRDNGPASRLALPDGSTMEEYYNNGKLHRDDGPAQITRCHDGLLIEGFYKNGDQIKEDRMMVLSSVPGVRLLNTQAKP